MARFYDVLKLMRVKSWIKNILIGLPLFFSFGLFDFSALVGTVWVFAGFCLIASSVYAVNDVRDAAYDRRQNDRKDRPVAAGRIRSSHALCLAAVLAICGLAGLLFLAGRGVFLCGLLYIGVNICYMSRCKHVPILDVACIAAGFVLRVYAGAAACGVVVSEWMFLTVVSASMFMGFGKRYGEMAFCDPATWRASVQAYAPEFLKGSIFLSAGLAIGFYTMWAMQIGGSRLFFSVPVLMCLLLRYLLDVFRGEGRGDPVRIFYSDCVLSFGVILYCGLMVVLLYVDQGFSF